MDILVDKENKRIKVQNRIIEEEYTVSEINSQIDSLTEQIRMNKALVSKLERRLSELKELQKVYEAS